MTASSISDALWKSAEKRMSLVLAIATLMLAVGLNYGQGQAWKGAIDDKVQQIQLQVSNNNSDQNKRIDGLEKSIEGLRKDNMSTFGAVERVSGMVQTLTHQLTYAK